jgi:hypothetical protein
VKRLVFVVFLAPVAIAAAYAVPSVFAAATFGSNGCGKSEAKPEVITLACADGKLLFKSRIWEWGKDEARATGIVTHPDIEHPSCRDKVIIACPWVETPATARLWRPVFCTSNARRQFTRLLIEAPDDIDPNVRVESRSFNCQGYAPQPPMEPWRRCGNQPRTGAGWGRVRSHGIGCRKARAVAHRYTWSAFSGNRSPEPYGFACRDRSVGVELSRVACRRVVDHLVQRVRFVYGA